MNIIYKPFYTKMNITSMTLLAIFASGLNLQARADVTTSCRVISSVPYVISYPGVYCFSKTLDINLYSGYAISIITSNVILDLNQFTLNNTSASSTNYAIGIKIANRKNVTIRNGKINNFGYGIRLYGSNTYSKWNTIKNMTLFRSGSVGIYAGGYGNKIINNQIIKTGNSSPYRTFTASIYTYGRASHVANNHISNVFTTGSHKAYGLYSSSQNSVFKNNQISNVTSTTGMTYGAYMTGTNSRSIISNNIIGGVGTTLYCQVSRSAKYFANTFYLAGSKSTPCVNGGGNRYQTL